MILIGTPYKQKVATNGQAGRRRAHHRWVLPTDRGDLLTEEAARIVGLKVSAMVTRVNRVVNGIIPADLLFSGKREMLVRTKKKAKMAHRVQTDDFCSVPDEDAGKYAHLSARTRERNLQKIPAMGTWEARHYGQARG